MDLSCVWFAIEVENIFKPIMLATWYGSGTFRFGSTEMDDRHLSKETLPLS